MSAALAWQRCFKDWTLGAASATMLEIFAVQLPAFQGSQGPRSPLYDDGRLELAGICRIARYSNQRSSSANREWYWLGIPSPFDERLGPIGRNIVFHIPVAPYIGADLRCPRCRVCTFVQLGLPFTLHSDIIAVVAPCLGRDRSPGSSIRQNSVHGGRIPAERAVR
jgi:hypothetical protein